MTDAEARNLRAFLDAPEGPAIDDGALRRRRPHANDLCRTAFTSGTTGDPKAVLHLHNTTNCAARFVNSDGVVPVPRPDGVPLPLTSPLCAKNLEASGTITARTARRIAGFAGSLNAGSCRSNSKVAYTDTSAAVESTAANAASAAVGWRWSVAANRRTRVLMLRP